MVICHERANRKHKHASPVSTPALVPNEPPIHSVPGPIPSDVMQTANYLLSDTNKTNPINDGHKGAHGFSFQAPLACVNQLKAFIATESYHPVEKNG